ncbi:MAG: S8 family serine peptidase [Myxococcota bacterium]
MISVRWNVVGCVLILVSCGGGEIHRKDPSAEVTVTASPFAAEKVIVRSSERGAGLGDGLPPRVALIEPTEPLQILINNQCFAQLGDAERSAYLSEQLVMDRTTRLELPFQSYTGHVRAAMDVSILETAAGEVPCLLGITNEATDQLTPSALPSAQRTRPDLSHLEYLDYAVARASYLSTLATTGPAAVVAVVDSGIDIRHPELAPLIFENSAGERFFNFTDDPDGDVSGHGTHVAGLAASLHNFNPNSISLMAVKALGDNGSGSRSAVFNGVMAAVANKADVINLSLSGVLSSGVESYVEAFRIAINSGALVVVAAGNQGRTVVPLRTTVPGRDPRLVNGGSQGPWPAGLSPVSGVIAVGSDDVQTGFRSTFSNHGPFVELRAPGCERSGTRSAGTRHQGLWSTWPGGGWARSCGTSMASPVVAAAGAFLVKHFRGGGQALHPIDAEVILTGAAGTGGDGRRLSLTSLAEFMRETPVLDGPSVRDDTLDRYVAGFYTSFLLDAYDPGEARWIADQLRGGGKSLEWMLSYFIRRRFGGAQLSCDRREYSLIHLAATGGLPERAVQDQTCAYLRGVGSVVETWVDVVLASEEMMQMLEQAPELSALPLFEGGGGGVQPLEVYAEVSRQVRVKLHRPAVQRDLIAYGGGALQDVVATIERGNEFFLLRRYEEILFRDLTHAWRDDADGLRYWLGALDAGEPRGAIDEHLLRSDERFAQGRAEYYIGRPLFYWYWEQAHARLASPSYGRVDLEEDIINLRWSGAREHLMNTAPEAARAFLSYHNRAMPDWLVDTLGRDPIPAFVAHVYREHFRRDPAFDGMRYWSDMYRGDSVLLEAQIILGASGSDRDTIVAHRQDETRRFLEMHGFVVPGWLK